MKKKIIGIFVCMLMITTGVLPIVGSDTKTASKVVEEKDCDCSEKTYTLGIFHPPVMTEIPQFSVNEDDASSIALIDTPEYFNWMDYEGQDWTTPVKNQAIPVFCGSCWAFAALGALESVINIREGIADLDLDLSEQYVLSCLPAAGSCRGGDPWLAFKYIRDNTSKGNNCNGTILEACFPYQANDTVPCDEKSENWEDYLIPILSYGTILNPQAQRELVKSTIMQKGPIVALMLYNDNISLWVYTHHSPDEYFPYEFANKINHAIVIVGWKDDSSIGKGGYWICKNSFGTLSSYNGFFNIEYESLAMERYQMVWVDYDPGSYDWHPVPKAYGPYYGLINQPLQFTGDASGEHPPFTWLWDFGDGTTSEEQNPTHTYLSTGDYAVTLTVTDEKGKSFSTNSSAWIQETNSPPETPFIDGPAKVKPGWCWYNFTVNDSDGNMLYLYWECWNMSPGLWEGPYPSNEVIPGYGNWTETGTFTVRMKAKDPYGAESDWATLSVKVPYSYNAPTLLFWEQVFQRFPYAFPILRHLMGY